VKVAVAALQVLLSARPFFVAGGRLLLLCRCNHRLDSSAYIAPYSFHFCSPREGRGQDREASVPEMEEEKKALVFSSLCSYYEAWSRQPRPQ
jgi:hypothetical protein